MSNFRRAERKQVKLKIALTGPSGAGKTYSALLLAEGIGKKIGLIDSENDSASLYSDRFQFESLNLQPPYTITKYNAAIEEAVAAGFDVLVIDSLTHAWAGEGGLLDRKAKLDERGGNSYANWNKMTPEHEALKAKILGANIHIIATMRSKQDYVLELNDKGKQVPHKVGLAPIQREGMEYEFTTVFDIAQDHVAAVSKDRTGLFDGFIAKLTKKVGSDLMTWLQAGKPVETSPPPPAPPVAPLSVSPMTTASVPPPLTATLPRGPSGVACADCKAELVLHVTKAGYVCPNAKVKGDAHTRALVDQLEVLRRTQPFTAPAQQAQGA